MKKALRKGGADALNLYSVGFESWGGLLGYSEFFRFRCYDGRDGLMVWTSRYFPGGLLG